MSRSPHGERGLKCTIRAGNRLHPRRSPHGERGLKFIARRKPGRKKVVAPHTGSVD